MVYLGPDTSRVLEVVDNSFEGVVWNKEQPPLDSELTLTSTIASELVKLQGSILTTSGTKVGLDPHEYPSIENAYLVHVGPTSSSVLTAIVKGIPLKLGAVNTTEKNKILVVLDEPGTVARVDLVFLEVWRALLIPDDETNKLDASHIWRYGNTQFQAAIGNPDLDDQSIDTSINFPTSYRIQFQYRFRHVSDVDFTNYTNGVDDPDVLAQGASETPVDGITFSQMADDASCYVAGDGDPGNGLGTIDGYVYAIPIQKISRRASSDPTASSIFLSDITNINPLIKSTSVLYHHDLLGLTDDDHPQYLNEERHEGLSHSFVEHGNLSGLSDDDHPQYLPRDGSRAMDGVLYVEGDAPEITMGLNDDSWSFLVDPDAGGTLQIFSGDDAVVVLTPTTSVSNKGDAAFRGDVKIIGDLGSNLPTLAFKSGVAPFTWRVRPQTTDLTSSNDKLQFQTDKSGTYATTFSITPEGGILGDGVNPLAVDAVLVKTHNHDGTSEGGVRLPASSIEGGFVGFNLLDPAPDELITPANDGTISIIGASGISITSNADSSITISGSGIGAVSKIIAGNGISISPTSGLGDVTTSVRVGNYLGFSSGSLQVLTADPSGAPSQSGKVVKADDTRWATLVGGSSSNADSLHTHSSSGGSLADFYKTASDSSTSTTNISTTFGSVGSWTDIASATLTGLVSTHHVTAMFSCGTFTTNNEQWGEFRITMNAIPVAGHGMGVPSTGSSGQSSASIVSPPISGFTGSVVVKVQARHIGQPSGSGVVTFQVKNRTLNVQAIKVL